ncbi:MAG: YceD family protein [Pseudomonadota bacterium]|nr:MAG: hypothetical protein DIU78_15960 [Pseudomonadota bacterium]
MTRPEFAVPVADLARGEKSATWRIPTAWLKKALADTEAEPVADGELSVELSKSGADVMVRGHATVRVTVPCVVTLTPLTFDLNPEIFLLLSPASPAPAPAKVAPARSAGGGRRPERDGRPKARGGKGEKSDLRGWAEDPELSPEQAARDTYDGETVVLDDFVREFIVLELPLYPRCPDLPSDETPAIAPPSRESGEDKPIDPRLQPLAAIAKRLGEQKKE